MPGLSKIKRVAMHCGAVNMISSIFAFWCEPFSLLLTWIAFFSVVLWWLRKSRSRDVHGLKGDGRRLTHFRDLPSPRGFPVVGNVVQLGAEPYRKLAEWADAYGPLYRIRMGTRDVLIVTGLDVIKKTAAKQSIDFAGRPELETNKLICGRQSITFNDYSDHWMRHKRCAKEALQLYTTGKDPSKRSVMEDCAFRHANHLVDQVLDQASREEGVAPEPFSLRNAINSISEMCFGHEFKPGDRAFDIFLDINKNFDGAMGASQVVNFWPFLKYVPFVGTPYKNLKMYSDDFWSFVLNLLKDHWRTYRPDQMRDFVDCLKYRSELANREDDVDPAEENMNGNQQKRQTNGAVSNGKAADPAKYAPGKQQSASPLDKNTNYAAADVFGAGFDTVHTVVTWAFFYLAVYPETQTKIRDELARVMAPDEQPTLRNHGPRCPYTQAWLYEVLRHVAIVPLFIPHQTTKGTVLENCYIPPGVMVIFNFWQTTRDPLLWDDPEEFRPERFLRTNPETGLDELRGDMAKNVIAWGLGVRQCLGAQLSRHQLFIFITTIVRRCLIAQSRPGIEPAYPWPSKLGLTIKPEPFKVSISPL